MDTPKPPSEMTDDEIRREWECIEECDFSSERTDALAAEMETRQIDV